MINRRMRLYTCLSQHLLQHPGSATSSGVRSAMQLLLRGFTTRIQAAAPVDFDNSVQPIMDLLVRDFTEQSNHEPEILAVVASALARDQQRTMLDRVFRGICQPAMELQTRTVALDDKLFALFGTVVDAGITATYCMTLDRLTLLVKFLLQQAQAPHHDLFVHQRIWNLIVKILQNARNLVAVQPAILGDLLLAHMQEILDTTLRTVWTKVQRASVDWHAAILFLLFEAVASRVVMTTFSPDGKASNAEFLRTHVFHRLDPASSSEQRTKLVLELFAAAERGNAGFEEFSRLIKTLL